jgi:RNA polymerase sigma-70 factor (ECF subfamily)
VASDSVERLLASLPPDQRAAVVLVDGEGFDNQTAATMLGVAVGTVASRLSRARATLRSGRREEER